MKDKCKNCGGWKGLHHYQSMQCPVGGRESNIGRPQEWMETRFEQEDDSAETIATLQAENARLRALLARAADGLECAAHDLYSHNLDGTRYAQDVKAARAELESE